MPCSYPTSAIKDPLAVGGNWQEAGKHIPLAQNGSVPVIEDEVITLGQFIVKAIVHSTHPDGGDHGTHETCFSGVRMNTSLLGWSATSASGTELPNRATVAIEGKASQREARRYCTVSIV